MTPQIAPRSTQRPETQNHTPETGDAKRRGPRRMPQITALLRHHDAPARCWKCHRSATDDPGRLVRAHVIDRALGGLDGPQNLRPLCEQCHAHQPVFAAGDEDAALRWFNTTGDPRRALAWRNRHRLAYCCRLTVAEVEAMIHATWPTGTEAAA